MPSIAVANSYRGAVRPPFIEGRVGTLGMGSTANYRGAVRPPFIEGARYSAFVNKQ